MGCRKCEKPRTTYRKEGLVVARRG
uniref:Uncharacterized protein n=1 Tax=Musa acuminata subsp. malaccensis TaxID=214687 RepID=A0A804J5C1_MUSAM